MRIAKYISNLLFEYECVVIPGLGGFITNELPAKINTSQHSFSPPSKKIVFNARLQTNDGMLVNQIAEKEKISYTDARMRVDNFVAKCHKALDNYKRIHFHKIGILFKETSGEILFEPDNSYNYLADSYGLRSFISPAIKRDPSVRIEKKFKDRKPKKEKEPEAAKEIPPVNQVKKPRYVTINVFGLIILLTVIALVVVNFGSIQKLYNNYSSVIPFFYSTPNEYFIMNHGDKIPGNSNQNKFTANRTNERIVFQENEEMPASLDNQAEELSETLDNSTTNNNIQQEETISDRDDEEITEQHDNDIYKNEPEITPPRFYIIAGSFEDEGNANKLVRQLYQKNFDAAIIGRNQYGFYRVAYAGYSTRPEAEEQLAIIRREENPSAWIFSEM